MGSIYPPINHSFDHKHLNIFIHFSKHITKSFLFLLMRTSYMSFPMFITKILITFCALRSRHTYISTITIITLWRFLRHFSRHRYLILLIRVSNQHHIEKNIEKLFNPALSGQSWRRAAAGPYI